MSSSDAAVSVRGLSKSYVIAHNAEKHTLLGEALVSRLRQPFRRAEKETFWALRDVSFDVKRGDVVGIIGRNGAGKSTLLKVLSRITEPTAGEVRLRGRVGSLLEVGTGFHPELTGRENIYLNGAILGMKRREIARQFDAIVDFAEVEQFLDTPVKRYSSGMYVRLAFAVAAHLNPEILVVDEVLAVGDAQFQKKCLGKMRDVSTQEGRTVLFVSHNMAAVQSLCRSVAHLRKGRLCDIGPGERVVASYVQEGSVLSSGVDLSRPAGRTPGSIPIVKALEFTDGDGEATASVPMGSALRIRLCLDSPAPLVQPVIGIAVNSMMGQRLFLAGTRYSDTQLSRVDRETWVECVLPDLNLMPGQYAVKVTVGDSNRDLDTIEEAAGFEVVPGDYFRSGQLPQAQQSLIGQRSLWQFLPVGNRCDS